MEISRGVAAGVALLAMVAGAGTSWVATRSEPASPGPMVAEGVNASEAAVEASEAVVPPVTAAPAAAVTTRRPAERPRAARAVPPAVRPAAEPIAIPESTLPPPAMASRADTAAPVLEMEPPVLPVPEFEEVEIAADSVLGLQIDSSISSERAEVEDPVTARVTRAVHAGERVAIPAGSRAEGEVTLVERGGRLKERARLGVRFTSVVLADGTRVPIDTETIYREGDAPSTESAAKIGGGAIGGAIIGGILGGAKGAIIGGSAGAGAGTAAVLAGGRNPATLPSGTPVTVRISQPAVVTLERPAGVTSRP